MIDDDFPPLIAKKLLFELLVFGDMCYYDTKLKKIVYKTAEYALSAYLMLQHVEMDKHKWIESEKAGKDVGDFGKADWVIKYAKTWVQEWKKTHAFIA